MRQNQAPAARQPLTHEGARAVSLSPEQQLERTVLACLLWEDSFYESGESVAERIKRLVPLCNPQAVAALVVLAREEMKLRHAPLLLVRELSRYPSRISVAGLVDRVIKRPDEITELLALFAAEREGKAKKLNSLPKQVLKGIARAFTRFNEYSLAKYNRHNPIKLRDALFLSHAKPVSDEQAALWKRLIDGKLAIPDTWETQLSAGADKKATFERLLAERKLGSLALLRNLRNMTEAGVSVGSITEALLLDAPKTKALPFRYLAAARAVPALSSVLERAMLTSLEGAAKLPGRTILLVDVSGSMQDKLSAKSDLSRLDAAKALAILLVEICETVGVMTFDTGVYGVTPSRGMALADNIGRTRGGTDIGFAVSKANQMLYDRIIVFTDEQSRTPVPQPHDGARAYMVNVASNEHSVAEGAWTSITGFSEGIVRYIQAVEAV